MMNPKLLDHAKQECLSRTDMNRRHCLLQSGALSTEDVRDSTMEVVEDP